MEILVVMAIFVIIAGFGLVVSMDAYRSNNFRSEEDMLLGVLLKARSQAVNNVDQKPHGVHITSANYSIFEGATYTSGIDFPVSSGFTPGGATDIVFSQLTGQISGAPLTVTLKDNTTGKIFTISINNEGQINY